ncbi:PREDICTED: agglutinin-like protein 5 [Priapulus caudatus]|uniref:Agglutinin-like protein 5 n=1 Tax=Priapulus caudatus TaxID=37621 RepID=A0ABM1E4F0_PRICU|nr:PREDICTED: agglutinin-like protein 5 [Priapulus caudatus]
MRLVVLLEFGILSYLVNVSSQQSIGKVHIGYPAHLNQAVADPEVYRFRENDLTGIIPVFVNTINSKAAETDDVNVTCILIPDSAVGYALVRFGGVVVSGSVGHGEVPLDILGPGREVAVTCSGESSVYNLTSGRQFEYNTSTSSARELVVSGAATVQICGEVVLVPPVVGKFDTFRLSFSDVLESSVKIFCSAVQDQGGSNMELEFTSPEVASGVHEASISYRLLSPGVSTYVICVGQSVSGDQYLNSTSGREAVSFVLDVGDIAIIPSLATVRTTSFDAFLILDAPVADDGPGDVTFQCRVEQMDDAHEAIAARDSARCQLPSSAPAAVASRADDAGEVMTEGLPEAPTSTAADHNIEKRQVTASTSTSTSVPVTATTGTVTLGAAEGLTNEPNVEPSSTEVTGVTLGEIGTTSEPQGQLDSSVEIALTDESETVTGGDDISGIDKTPIQQSNVTSASTANVTTTEQPNVATTSTASDSMTQKTNLTSPSPANGTTTEQPNVTTTSTANDSTTQETNVTSLSTANDTTMEEANASVASTGTDNTTLSHVAVNGPTSIALQPDTDMPVEPWELERETLVLTEGDLFRKLALRRSSYPALPVIEYLLVTCCATPDTNQNPKYTNRSAAAFVVADLQSAVVVNWTSAADVLDEDRETEMEKAEYVEVAPCVCDLSAGHCDTNCCCDTDCRAGSIASFHCKEGLPGGQPAAPYTYNCSSTHFDRAGWFPALCVQKSNTPYLGEYYPTLPALFTETR